MIHNTDDVSGYRIFMFEGIFTTVVAVIEYLFLHHFPEDATFLSEGDEAYILARLKHRAGKASSNTLAFTMVFSMLRDWRM